MKNLTPQELNMAAREQFSLLVKQAVHGLEPGERDKLLTNRAFPLESVDVEGYTECAGCREVIYAASAEDVAPLRGPDGEQIVLGGLEGIAFITGVLSRRERGNGAVMPLTSQQAVEDSDQGAPVAPEGESDTRGPYKQNEKEDLFDPTEGSDIEESEEENVFGLSWLSSSSSPVQAVLTGSTWCPVTVDRKLKGAPRADLAHREVARSVSLSLTPGERLGVEVLPESPYVQLDEATHRLTVNFYFRQVQTAKGVYSNSLSVKLGDTSLHARLLSRVRLELAVPAADSVPFEHLQPNPNPLFSHVPTRAIGNNAAATWREEGESLKMTASFWPEFNELAVKHVGSIAPIPSMQELGDLLKRFETHLDCLDWIHLGEEGEAKKRAAYDLLESCKEGLAWMNGDCDRRVIFEDAALAVMSEDPMSPNRQDWALPLKDRTWRPFQLLLFLSAVASTAEEDHPRRKEVVAIEFPTGGGKTESYLLLAAYTILYARRRLTLEGATKRAGGARVLMRYPLRLLAAQQFSRAAKVVSKLSVCMAIRNTKREGFYNPKLGPVRTGLWVGDKLSPNRWEKVTPNNLTKVLPVSSCPLCSESLTLRSSNNDSRLYCENPDCYFGAKYLAKRTDPLRDARIDLVDGSLDSAQEENGTYANRPEFLLATLDKIAITPWRMKSVKNLFNKSLQLVIQDELHMLDDELGSMEGLYQTVLERLVGTTPKIVVASATTKNTSGQVKLLYNRDALLRVPAAEVKDGHWFVAEPDSKLRTTVVGIMPNPVTPSRRISSRLLAAQAQAAQVLLSGTSKRFKNGDMSAAEFQDALKAIDPYWTNLAFFGSRPALRQVSISWFDEIPSSAVKLSWAFQHPGNRRAFNFGQKLEASSDSPSTIAEIISSLESGLSAEGEKHPDSNVAGLCLATSMIEVGVDVDRLGLMTFMGQPKEAASYIQAGGRVGRRYPAMTYILYRRGNVRDSSFFEDFQGQNSRRNDKVEPSLLNPYSPGAVKRALGALTVIKAASASVNQPVEMLDEEEMLAHLREVSDELSQRAGWGCAPEWLRGHIEKLMAGYRVAKRDEIKYLVTPSQLSPSSKGKTCLLVPLSDSLSEESIGGCWTAPTSLRSVAGEASSLITTAPLTHNNINADSQNESKEEEGDEL